MGIIDWDRIWNNDLIVTSRTRLDTGSFWDGMADRGKDVEVPQWITDRQMELISPSRDERVLEIGPGSGRLAIPLARASSHLTAVDPSGSMLERLRGRARDEGIDNILYLNMGLKDLEPSMLDGRPDVIVGAFSIFMSDISVQLKKMNEIARNRVFLFLPADPRMPDEVQNIVFGSRATSGLGDHVILFNILHDLGIDPNVRMMRYISRKTYGSLDEATSEFASYHNVPEEKMDRFREYMDGILRRGTEGYVLERERRIACVWWEKI